MSEPLGITGVDFVSAPTQNLERAVEFYGTTLGLECSVHMPELGYAEFETGNVTINVFDAAVMGMEFAPNPNLMALNVADVGAARERLESDGFVFKGPTLDTGVCHMAWFADPDGNGLTLHHRYAPRMSQVD
jgi:predicted enzyme related to lactoylglutathione lyase